MLGCSDLGRGTDGWLGGECSVMAAYGRSASLSLSAFGEGRYISGLCVVRDASAMLLLQLLA